MSTRSYQYSECTTLKFSVEENPRRTFTTLLWKSEPSYDYLTANLEKGRKYEIPRGFVVSETNRGLLGVKTVFNLLEPPFNALKKKKNLHQTLSQQLHRARGKESWNKNEHLVKVLRLYSLAFIDTLLKPLKWADTAQLALIIF